MNNKWIGYVDRTYQQIKDKVLTDLSILTPEITDHTESNPFVKMLSIWSGIAEMLGYYIDNAAREAHLSTVRLYWSAVKIARAYDYRIFNHIPSTGSVSFMLDQTSSVDVTIPSNTELEGDNGLLYYTTESVTIEAGMLINTTSIQQFEEVPFTVIGNSSGTPSQEIVIDDNIVDKKGLVLKVGNIGWTFVETLAYSAPDDLHYSQSVNENKDPIIVFGDGFNGKIPDIGDTIELSYYTTSGDVGNTSAGTITTINSNVSTPPNIELTCMNKYRTSGGQGIETLEQLKRRIPKSIRTLMRAVTEQDFIDIVELKSGVARAGLTYDCGADADIYIVPEGGGLASTQLINDTQNWIDERRVILINTNVHTAGEVRIIFDIDVNILPQFTKTSVVDEIKTRLTEFLSYEFQQIEGKVYLSDIYEKIETTTGVDNSRIKVMTPRPYARPLGGSYVELNWDRQVQPTSNSTIRWKIKMTSSNNFDLMRDEIFIGNFAVGSPLIYTSITFTVNSGSYSIGDSWEFYSYPYFGTIELAEPSIPVSLGSDININASGGL